MPATANLRGCALSDIPGAHQSAHHLKIHLVRSIYRDLSMILHIRNIVEYKHVLSRSRILRSVQIISITCQDTLYGLASAPPYSDLVGETFRRVQCNTRNFFLELSTSPILYLIHPF